MSTESSGTPCDRTEALFDYALRVLPAEQAADVESHLAGCERCRKEIEMLRPVVDSFVSWPVDVVRPSASLWSRLAERIGADAGDEPRESLLSSASPASWNEPQWKQVAPGISCKLLANDTQRQRISMLVRLDPGTDYPPHRHAGVEELHLLHGELWIDDKKLYPGDYNRAEPGTADARVWSETGCTCVLVTSTRDVLG
jgi:anti-sigma factor ChrR (cupin superfamily)